MKYYEGGAPWYDALSGAGVPGDVAFYSAEARKPKGKVLEAACGSGRIFLKLLAQGTDAYGFDLSPDMLGVLERKAAESKLDISGRVKKADMRSFRYPFRFDLVIIPYRAFLHMEAREDQKACLMNVRRHLKKGGRLILNFFDPKLDIIAKIDVLQRTGHALDPETGRMVRYESRSHYDIPEQRISAHYRMKGAGRDQKLDLSLCYIFPREFMNMLELCGFRKWELYGGFDRRPYTKNGEELVWVAHR
ncbi:MAG: class I SAM-dependent methyltransferase [Candidatus Micrarchaeota archaeon]